MFQKIMNNNQSRMMSNHFQPKDKKPDMMKLVMDTIPQAIGIMQERGITGSQEELHSLLKEHGIEINDFIGKAKGFLRNPLYVGALKKAGAPIEDIKNIIFALSGEKVDAVAGNTGAKTNRTRFKRV